MIAGKINFLGRPWNGLRGSAEPYGSSSAPASNGLLNMLAAYWKMDESSGNRADSTGSGNTLTEVSSVFSTSGIINNAALFDGSFGNSLTFSSSAFLPTGTSDFTFSFWANLTGTASDTPTLLEAPDYLTGYLFRYFYANSVIQVFLAGNSWDFAYTLNLSQTYNIIFKRESSVLTVYVNGVSIGSVTSTESLDTSTGTGMIGQDNRDNVDPWIGFIDEVGVWSRALTASQIAAVYNGGAGKPFSTFTT